MPKLCLRTVSAAGVVLLLQTNVLAQTAGASYESSPCPFDEPEGLAFVAGAAAEDTEPVVALHDVRRVPWSRVPV